MNRTLVLVLLILVSACGRADGRKNVSGEPNCDNVDPSTTSCWRTQDLKPGDRVYDNVSGKWVIIQPKL